MWFDILYIDVAGLGGQAVTQEQGAPTFRATTDCPFNWEWIALAFVAGALTVYLARK
jgi:hypothetical protein